MHPLYKLRDTGLEEPQRAWVGRKVVDRFGRHLGHVREILVEERTLQDALAEDHDPQGWTGRAAFALVTVETGRLGRFRARREVTLPLPLLNELADGLMVDQDGDEIRLALGS
ncbi:MAG: hypothetical protein JOZ39_01955 [Chloroflexi bacterium]|nr:hypothetical protein [Chloroflexota bacterium]